MHINNITLISKDLDAQEQFFGEKLLLPVKREPNCLQIKVGTSTLTFQQGDVAGRYHYAFDIPQNQFAEAKVWLESRDIPLAADCTGKQEYDFTNINAHAMYFRDADGNIGELIARHNLPTERMMPFSENSLLRISEIGLATPHVIETVERLKAHGIPVWTGHGSETFSMMGTETGLLIVVHQGRYWLPTNDTPALPIPTQIEMQGVAKTITFDDLPYAINAQAIPSI